MQIYEGIVRIFLACVVTDCGPLTDPVNGHVHAPHGTTYKQVATYSCDLGFTLIGPVLRTCGVNREWTQETPQCLGKLSVLFRTRFFR